MSVVKYTVPITYTPEDNSTFVIKHSIIMKDCSNVFGRTNETCDGWNFNRCPNDKAYCQPFIAGDLIYAQFLADVKKYQLVSFQVYNSDTEEDFYSASFLSYQIGRDASGNVYLNYIIDTGNAAFNGVNCWYTRITLLNKETDQNEYLYSEPYCLVKCNEATLLITGEYPSGYDCFGNYYGSLITNNNSTLVNIYKASFRVRGEVVSDGFDFEKTSNVKKVVKSQQTERFIMMLKPVPYYVAKQVAVCFNSKATKIDGLEYSGTVKLNKNFEEGSMWIIRENILLECDEINFTCD